MEITGKVPLTRISGSKKELLEDTLVREYMLKIAVNGSELIAFLCSPKDLEHLTLGFLFSEGLINSKTDVEKLKVDYSKGVAKAEVKGGCGRGMTEKPFGMGAVASGGARSTLEFTRGEASLYPEITSEMTITPQTIFHLMQEFAKSSLVFKDTGGVHSAAAASKEGLIYSAEDIGRHNALEKVFGYCLDEGIDLGDKLILTSGRVSSEILLKTARRSVPFLVSKSAPTDEGVKLAQKLGITLIGFVRGERMNIYSHNRRVVLPDAR